jgi:hypothetical protein
MPLIDREISRYAAAGTATHPARGSAGRLLCFVLLFFAVSAGVASLATASDGRVELDQLCAVSTGCMAGDAPGFPITITGEGGRSFVLTTDLVVSGSNVDGIQLYASDVSIDLNDHTILRAECVGATTNCSTGASNAAAIRDTFSTSIVGGLVVHDGTVLGFTSGLLLGRGAEVRNVVARWNGNGLRTRGRGFLLLDSAVEANASIGVVADEFDSGGVIVGNRISRNEQSGLVVDTPGCVATDNVSFENGSGGLGFDDVAVVVDNLAYGNKTNGLWAFDGSVVHRNTAYDNDLLNLLIAGGTLVRGNVARGSAGEGIVAALPTGQGHLENVASDNAGGDYAGTWVDLGANACGGTPGCP